MEKVTSRSHIYKIWHFLKSFSGQLILCEEVKGKEALQRKLNEKEVNEQLKR